MRHQGPFGDEPNETESRRLTPSIGLTHDEGQNLDTANEDFLFHLYRGSELLQDNRVHEAKEELEQALHLQPRDSKGQDLLAVVYFRLGHYPRAIQIYEQLRRRSPNDTSLLLNLALCYLKVAQPQLARHDLEHLLSLNPTHTRAWGYLGIACERLGDLAHAEQAFQKGGHHPMAKRVAAKRPPSGLPLSGAAPAEELRDVADAAYQELDTGELTFTLAAPTSQKDRDSLADDSWHSIERGRADEADIKKLGATGSDAPRSSRPGETRKPDTRDGPQREVHSIPASMVPSIPQLGLPTSPNRRPTLIAPVGAPPAHDLASSEFAAVEQIPTYNPPPFSIDEPAPIISRASIATAARRPVVAVGNPFGPAKSHDAPHSLADGARTGTLTPRGPVTPPPGIRPRIEESGKSSAPGPDTPLGMGPPHPHAPQSLTARAPAIVDDEALPFPKTGGVALHSSGVALVRTTESVGFAARLEAIRVQQAGLRMHVLERQVRGKSSGESFGGVASPMVLASSDGELVLGARTGRKLFAFALAGDMCFAREDVLLGFGGALVYENGRLTTGEGEFVPVVQLRGEGEVLLETIAAVLTLPVHADRSLSVRREVVLGWLGRLVPRALPPNEAPCGQRGLVSFAGEGRVLITSA
jgi:hypothetical protein